MVEDGALVVYYDSASVTARKPSRVYPGDAGLDLEFWDAYGEPADIGPGEFRDLPCGLSVDLPRGYWGLITGRSSTIRKRGLLVTQGVIDHGFQGSLFVGVWNLNNHPVRVNPGERLGQLIVLPLWAGAVHVGDPASRVVRDRAGSGFGSSGS